MENEIRVVFLNLLQVPVERPSAETIGIWNISNNDTVLLAKDWPLICRHRHVVADVFVLADGALNDLLQKTLRLAERPGWVHGDWLVDVSLVAKLCRSLWTDEKNSVWNGLAKIQASMSHNVDVSLLNHAAIPGDIALTSFDELLDVVVRIPEPNLCLGHACLQ